MTLPHPLDPNAPLHPYQPVPGEDAERETGPVAAFLRTARGIEPSNMEEEFASIPGQLAFATARYARAYRDQLRAEAGMKNVRAMLRIYHRERMVADGTPKPTESQVEAAVELDPRYVRAHAAEIDAEVALAYARGDVDTIKAKKDMLQSIGANMRAEMNMDPAAPRAAAGARRVERSAAEWPGPEEYAVPGAPLR